MQWPIISIDHHWSALITIDQVTTSASCCGAVVEILLCHLWAVNKLPAFQVNLDCLHIPKYLCKIPRYVELLLNVQKMNKVFKSGPYLGHLGHHAGKLCSEYNRVFSATLWGSSDESDVCPASHPLQVRCQNWIYLGSQVKSSKKGMKWCFSRLISPL